MASEGPQAEPCAEGLVTIECSEWWLAGGYFAEGYYCVSPDLHAALEQICADQPHCRSETREDGVISYECDRNTCS